MTHHLFSHRRLLALTTTLLLGLTAALPSAATTWGDAQRAFADYNDAAGLKLLEQAAEEGDPQAMQAWGLALLHGRRLFPLMQAAEPKRAAVWFDKLARRCADADVRSTEPVCSNRSAVRLAKQCPAHTSELSTGCPVALVMR